jgi:hypothetical protein
MLSSRSASLAVLTGFPIEFWVRIREAGDVVPAMAVQRIAEDKMIGDGARRRMIGQHRHAYWESALLDAGRAVELRSNTMPYVLGRPDGYSIVFAEHAWCGRAKLANPEELLPDRAYRRGLASGNIVLGRVQGDLFGGFPELPPEARPYVVVISGVDRFDLRRPAFINIAIPTADLGGWIFNEPIENVMAAYAPSEKTEEKSVEVIPDRAEVQLKALKKK